MITSKNRNKIAAVIPFFNEKNTVNRIIQATFKHVDAVIAIDDGSTDDSCSGISLQENITLLTNNTNRGKGYSLRKGLNYAVENGFDEPAG